ncbi:MAG: hypothetical protein LBJ73_00935 [Rickettsiales bacterium]|jgi:hypothetical protein|nr:hypothetical protein [Rickettsiales bacterium]
MSIFKNIFLGSLLLVACAGGAFAITGEGLVENSNDSSSMGYGGYNNITIMSDASLIVDATSGGYINVTNTFSVAKNFLHNGKDISVLTGDPTFYKKGGFAFTGSDSIVTAKNLVVGGDFINGDGASALNLALNVDAINVTGTFYANQNSTIVVTPNDWSANPSLTAGDINVAGSVYMGDSGTGTVKIASAADDNVYKISTAGTLDVDGNIQAQKGRLVINGDTVKVAGNVEGQVVIEKGVVEVAGNVLGKVDFDVGNLNIGNLTVDSNASLDWKDRFTDQGTGDLLADGTLNSTGDILIGGTVNGKLNIKGDADMWIGEDLLGYLGVDVDNLYVLGKIEGSGNIKADTVNVGGNLAGGSGGLVVDAGKVNVDGDLSGNLNIDADDILVNHDVLGGTKFRPNLPGGGNTGDAETQFHINPNGGAPGSMFKQTDLTIAGTYNFDDDSYLQLVLNSKTANSDGTAGYNPNTDDALITVGVFDARGVSSSPNFLNMDLPPNIEILVDNLKETIPKIRLINVTSGTIDMGGLDFAGLWFYWDKDNDGAADFRLFQEARLVADGNNIYAMVAMMNSIQRLTRDAAGAVSNDIQAAGAVDDLILQRLHGYSEYTTDDLTNYYTSVMRLLFPDSDVYYDLMLNGGAYRDAMDVMVSENPDYALGFVRGIGLDSVSTIRNKLELSGRTARNAVSDQLMEDYSWKRYYDKSVAWVRVGFGDALMSFDFGADTRVNKKFIAGFNFGYNLLDFGDLDGRTINLGLYGAYDLNDWARLHANLNLALHSVDAKTNSMIVREMKTHLRTADTVLDVGVLHKILDQYVTGRGYVAFGLLGGYEFTQKYKGSDFMDVAVGNRVILAPGYEISMGKDIWLSVGGFVRPSLKFGIEYDLLDGGSRNVDFKFSEVSAYRTWQASDSDSLWLRYGAQIDFSFIVGTNISVGYEVLKNGDFKANQFKLNGVYRF